MTHAWEAMLPTNDAVGVLPEQSMVRTNRRVSVIRDVRVPTEDPSVTLSADVILPVTASPVPALVTVLPYRKDATWGILDLDTCRWYARHGYACVLVDLRGIGSSDGRPRPPFAPDEADDGVAAVEWAATQPWCDGSVGMWGHSYGALMAMRVAARRPAHLRAILPLMGLLDPERDFVHPWGAQGGIEPVGVWGMQQLLHQLLPPLHGFGTEAEQRRWSRRLRDVEPWLVDLVRRGRGDPSWRARALDPATVTVPAFCVGGWQDIFCTSTLTAYERIRAPKKLLVGPWPHVMPDLASSEPVDFRRLSLRWWDHWLTGTDDGLMDEPDVTLYLQGDQPQWTQVSCWPPPAGELRLATNGDPALLPATAPQPPADGVVIGHCGADPTVGMFQGADQHHDGLRCTTAPVAEGIVVAGSPEVSVRLANPGAARRLVVRLADIDPDGRSVHITSGVLSSPAAETARVRLVPTCYRVGKGHRLRVVLGESDFPLLWPPPEGPGSPAVLSVELVLPTVSDTDAVAVGIESPPADADDVGALSRKAIGTVTRDLVHEGVEVTTGQRILARTPNREHTVEIQHVTTAAVRRDSPAAAHAHGTSDATVHLRTGETVRVHAEFSMTSCGVTATGRINIDGTTLFERSWEVTAPVDPTDERE